VLSHSGRGRKTYGLVAIIFASIYATHPSPLRGTGDKAVQGNRNNLVRRHICAHSGLSLATLPRDGLSVEPTLHHVAFLDYFRQIRQFSLVISTYLVVAKYARRSFELTIIKYLSMDKNDKASVVVQGPAGGNVPSTDWSIGLSVF
jgi:hypothetical protein